jgi:hypothetical protein
MRRESCNGGKFAVEGEMTMRESRSGGKFAAEGELKRW